MKVTALISLSLSPLPARQNQTEINDAGQDKHTREMHSKLSRRLKESTLIKMLTEPLSIYERGLNAEREKRSSVQLEPK